MFIIDLEAVVISLHFSLFLAINHGGWNKIKVIFVSWKEVEL